MAAESLKDLRRRLRSIRSIRQITRAMEMVAAAKLRRVQTRLEAGRPYAAKLQELLAHLSASTSTEAHPMLRPMPEGGGRRKLLVLFTADRGLCGSFNANLIGAAEQSLTQAPRAEWDLVCVGKHGRNHFARRGWNIVHEIIGLHGEPDLDHARRLAGLLEEQYRSGQYDSIWLLYAEFRSTVSNQPRVVAYLPMGPETLAEVADEPGQRIQEEAPLEYLFEPGAETVFGSLLPRYLVSRLYIAMAEHGTSEHSSRMVAMNNATKNCGEMDEDLTLQINKARQTTITNELLDIVGGAEALHE